MAPHKLYPDVSVKDIRAGSIDFSILDDIHKQLRPIDGGEKKLPTVLLYNERGLQLFEEITHLDEYYLTNAEIEVLERHADSIAQRVPEGSMVIELGSGNLRKVIILLEAFERAKKSIDYYALDLSLRELQRTLSCVPYGTFDYIRCHGLHGTYDDGLKWLKEQKNISRPKCIMSLGSSIGNFDRDGASSFLKNFAGVMQPTDILLVGLDSCQNHDTVYAAYNDRVGKTHEFVHNGLDHANSLLGNAVFTHADWDVVGEYDVEAGRHQAFYAAKNDVVISDVKIRAGERVRIEESYKYSAVQRQRLWEDAGFVPRAIYGEHMGLYHIHMLCKPNFSFSLDPGQYARSPVPSLEEFEQLWVAWGMATRDMIPNEELHSRPINLRNCCLFYLGHIPTFLDMHLTRATNGEPTEPKDYPRIFERGIDPDVENPELCHAHSEIPDTWPALEDILTFQEQVRKRARELYRTGKPEFDRKLGRAMWIAFEHEAMHLETLLYMLLQSDKIVAPVTGPDFEALAQDARIHAVPNQWIKIPEKEITIGHEDPEDDNGSERYFGWDIERPLRIAKVPAFEAKARPITNEEYARFLDATENGKLPASWLVSSAPGQVKVTSPTSNSQEHISNGDKPFLNGESPPLTDAYLAQKAVRTIFGPVPLAHALDWPVMASYDELARCAKWMHGRIPTMEEARSIYEHAEHLKSKGAAQVLSTTIPAVNSHLSNEGVEESPPSHPSHPCHPSNNNAVSLDPTTHFANLNGSNVGFKHFHPVPVTQNGASLSGQGDMGGVWEWTSSVLERHEGFEPMGLYPAYTQDFFDGKHNVVLGGSWATHPRIAGRKSFVNFYQRGYPYAWAGARLVREGAGQDGW